MAAVVPKMLVTWLSASIATGVLLFPLETLHFPLSKEFFLAHLVPSLVGSFVLQGLADWAIALPALVVAAVGVRLAARRRGVGAGILAIALWYLFSRPGLRATAPAA